MISCLQVVDIETGEPLGEGKDGEVCVRGPIVMKGSIAVTNTILDIYFCKTKTLLMFFVF